MPVTKTPTPGRHKLSRRGKLIINRQPLHMQVADSIRAMIVAGRFAGGEKVPGNELADELGVSLTPLREALKVLAGEHLIELTPNRGARVTPVTIDETRHLFEVLAGLEALAAELAAARITPTQLRRISQTHEEMRRHFETGDRAKYFDANRRIHDLVVEYAENPILSQLRSQLSVRAERARFLSVAVGTGRGLAMSDHELLVEALSRGDGAEAHRVWRKHLLRSGEECCAVLRHEASQPVAGDDAPEPAPPAPDPGP